MFGIGFLEIVVIAVVVLIFVGPKRLPELMREGGKLFVQLRRTANDVKSQFDGVIQQAEEEIRKVEREKFLKALELQQSGRRQEMVAELATPKPDDHPTVDHHSDLAPNTDENHPSVPYEYKPGSQATENHGKPTFDHSSGFDAPATPPSDASKPNK